MGPPVILSVDVFAGLETLFELNHNQINAGANRRVALGARPLPPGDYAWVETTRTIGDGNYGATGNLCLHRGAPVFSVGAGSISIVRLDTIVMRSVGRGQAAIESVPSPFSDDDVLQEFESARTNYPNIAGTASVQQPVAYIRWPEMHGNLLGLTRQCNEPATFERLATSPYATGGKH
ncbi:MAG: hypothetical protein ABUS57_05620 [Pseudomonadota bacterium]